MSEQRGATCYIVQAHKDAPVYLCVKDTGAYHTFPMSVGGCSRLAKECSAVVHSAISGFSEVHAHQEIGKLLSEKFGEK